MAFPYERVPFQVFSCVTHINYIIVSNCNRNCAVLQAILLHFIFECPFRSSFFLVNFSLLSHLLARRTKQIHLQENLFLWVFISYSLKKWTNQKEDKLVFKCFRGFRCWFCCSSFTAVKFLYGTMTKCILWRRKNVHHFCSLVMFRSWACRMSTCDFDHCKITFRLRWRRKKMNLTCVLNKYDKRQEA